MTRIEAYVALFGADCENTAVQDALDALEKAPHPTTDESNELATIPLQGGATVSDVVADFCDKPSVLIEALPDKSRRKSLLTELANKLAPASSGATSTATPAASTVPPASAPGVLTPPTPKPPASAKARAAEAELEHVRREPVQKPPTSPWEGPSSDVITPQMRELIETLPYSSRRKRLLTKLVRKFAPKLPGSPEDDGDPPEPEIVFSLPGTKPPTSPWEGASSDVITPEMRQRLPSADWQRLRDAAINAHRKNASEELAFLRATARGYKAGQHGFMKKLLGHLLDLLLDDLQAGLYESDTAEFQRRYF